MTELEEYMLFKTIIQDRISHLTLDTIDFKLIQLKTDTVWIKTFTKIRNTVNITNQLARIKAQLLEDFQ